jgi:hypothetical protein
MQGFGWRLPGHAYEEKVHLKRVLKWSTVAHVEFRSFVMVKKIESSLFGGTWSRHPSDQFLQFLDLLISRPAT